MLHCKPNNPSVVPDELIIMYQISFYYVIVMTDALGILLAVLLLWTCFQGSLGLIKRLFGHHTDLCHLPAVQASE